MTPRNIRQYFIPTSGRGFLAWTLLLILSARTANADWYSGDPYTAPTAWPQYTDNLSDVNQVLALTYDNFTWVPGVGGGVVDRVGGHFHSFGPDYGSSYDTAYWEIRTGVAHNVGGSLVSSGSGAVTSYSTSFTQGGGSVWATEVDVPNFTLPAGSYWFGLAIGKAGGNQPGAFVASTTGANGVGGPLGDDYSIYFQSQNNVVFWDYIDGTTVVGTSSAGLDPSYWIREVPEPSAVFLASSAAMIMSLVFRRRRGAKGDILLSVLQEF